MLRCNFFRLLFNFN